MIYDDRLPWPTESDGLGMSLNRGGLSLYGNDGTSWSALAPTPGSVSFEAGPGDFDADGRLNVADISLLNEQLQSPTPDVAFDLNADGVVDAADRDVLVIDLIGTSYGDADLDYVFDSRDLVRLFQIGQYEDGIAGNSTWESGDWNGDGDFTSDDLLLAAQGGGYVQAPAAPVAAKAVDRVAPSDYGRIAALEADRTLRELSAHDLDDDLLKAIV